jgi:hypothetical protein
MRSSRRTAALAFTVALITGGALFGTAVPAAAATEPTKLWNEYPLEPAPPHTVRSALPRLGPAAPPTQSRGDQTLFAGLALLFVVGAGAATVVTVTVAVLRASARRYY